MSLFKFGWSVKYAYFSIYCFEICHKLKFIYFCSFRCAECEEIFNKKSHLAEHIKTHTSKEKYPYICYHCGSQHSTEVKLKRHEIAHIPQEERQIYPCPHCDKR